MAKSGPGARRVGEKGLLVYILKFWREGAARRLSERLSCSLGLLCVCALPRLLKPFWPCSGGLDGAGKGRLAGGVGRSINKGRRRIAEKVFQGHSVQIKYVLQQKC